MVEDFRDLRPGRPGRTDFGPDLSRGFRALKTWFTIKTFGTDKLGAMIGRTCALARYLEARILAEPQDWSFSRPSNSTSCASAIARQMPTRFNINKVNADIVIDMQKIAESRRHRQRILDGRLAIRAAIVNHRTDTCDVDALLAAVLRFGAVRG